MLIGYVLCRFDDEPPWFFLFDRLRCVKSVVGFGGQPTPISATSIGALLQRQGEIVPHARSTNMRRSFGPGDEVRVALGGFRGFEGRVEAVRGAKARMILEFLGSRREIDIPLEALEAA
jgi:transcription antitermination factor NusG